MTLKKTKKKTRKDGVNVGTAVTKLDFCKQERDERFCSFLLTCTSHSSGVFESPVEAFITVTDGGRLVMARAV